MSKGLALLLSTVLALSSLVMVESVFAQSIPVPSVPEFTVTFESQNMTIVVTIRNQPFTSYTTDDGNLVRLSYWIDYKFDFDQYWDYLGSCLTSGSDYTVFTAICGRGAGEPELRTVQSGDKLSFRVQAYIGYMAPGYNPELSPLNANFIYEKSDWSEIKTLILPDDPPNITLLSPQNETFRISDVPLNFTVDNDAYPFQYSLDGAENVTVFENTTLAGVAYGCHSVTVYATDRLGNIGTSETVYFVVEEPFPTTLVIASAVIIVVVFAVFLLMQRKHKP